MSVAPTDEPRPRLIFYGMYDAARAGSAPRVRIQLLSTALARRARVTMVSGPRLARLAQGVRLVLGDLRHFDGVYVETATSSAMPWDLWFLAAARASGVPVGIYFRDAYPVHRDLYPLPGWRARLSDLGWRISVAAYRRLASVSFTPSRGLADSLRLAGAVLLPPGTDPGTPELGPGSEPVVAYVGALAAPVGFDRLVDAVRLVREELPEARLLAVGSTPSGVAPALPDWVEVRQASRDELASLLAGVSVCAIPLPINRYTNMAWPLKLSDYLAFGKPIVATATDETAAVLDGSGAGIVVGDTPAAIAAGLLRVLRDPELAARLAAASRRLALAPGSTWDDRAALIVERLAPAAARPA
jgi:glycosyltransferase involved in cell wall biosynthesis